MHGAGLLDRAQPHVGFGERFEDIDLVQVVRTFVHMRDVDGAGKRLFGKIGAPAFELCRAQPF